MTISEAVKIVSTQYNKAIAKKDWKARQYISANIFTKLLYLKFPFDDNENRVPQFTFDDFLSEDWEVIDMPGIPMKQVIPGLWVVDKPQTDGILES